MNLMAKRKPSTRSLEGERDTSTVQIALRMPAWMHDEILADAQAECRTLTGHLQFLILKRLAALKQGPET